MPAQQSQNKTQVSTKQLLQPPRNLHPTEEVEEVAETGVVAGVEVDAEEEAEEDEEARNPSPQKLLHHPTSSQPTAANTGTSPRNKRPSVYTRTQQASPGANTAGWPDMGTVTVATRGRTWPTTKNGTFTQNAAN